MNYNIDYLLQYVSHPELKEIKRRYNDYTLKFLEDDRVQVLNNIRFLIKYGIKNINELIVKDLEELLLNENEFQHKIENYEKTMTKSQVINMLVNI